MPITAGKACAKPGADNRWGGVDCKGRHPRVVIAGSALKGQRLVRNAHPTIYVWLIHGFRVESVSRLHLLCPALWSQQFASFAPPSHRNSGRSVP